MAIGTGVISEGTIGAEGSGGSGELPYTEVVSQVDFAEDFVFYAGILLEGGTILLMDAYEESAPVGSLISYLTVSDEIEDSSVQDNYEDTATFTAESEDTRYSAVADTLVLSNDLIEVREAFASDTLTLTDSAAAVTTQLAEGVLTLSDQHLGQSFQPVQDGIVFTDEGESLSRGSALLQETLTLSEVTVGRSGAVDEVETLVTFSDAQDDASADFVDVAATFSAQTEQTGVLSSEVLDIAEFASEVEAVSASQGEFSDVLTFSDAAFYKDPSATAWVMNTETAAPYWYSNWQFYDMVQVGDKVLAVGPEGLCVIGADTDAGETIDAVLGYGFADFGTEQKKRVPEFVFGYTAETPMGVTVETYGQGYPPYEYSLSAQRLSEQPNNGRLTPGKGLSARYWRIEIHNTDGGAFSVNSITASLAVSSRRL